MQRNCAFCGVQFQAIRRTAKFCGNTCRARYCLQRNSPKSRKPTPPAEHECTHCGETFISTHSPKYCSKECRNSAKSYEYKKTLTCALCAAPMFGGSTSLPQGVGVCQPCKRAYPKLGPNPATYVAKTPRDWSCRDCGAQTVGNANTRFCGDCKVRKKALHDNDKGHRRRALKYGVIYEPVTPRTIHERDGWCCGICRNKVDQTLEYPHPKSASLDHVLPISLGGDHVPANLQCAHLDCNVSKSNRGAPQQLALIG